MARKGTPGSRKATDHRQYLKTRFGTNMQAACQSIIEIHQVISSRDVNDWKTPSKQHSTAKNKLDAWEELGSLKERLRSISSHTPQDAMGMHTLRQEVAKVRRTLLGDRTKELDRDSRPKPTQVRDSFAQARDNTLKELQADKRALQKTESKSIRLEQVEVYIQLLENSRNRTELEDVNIITLAQYCQSPDSPSSLQFGLPELEPFTPNTILILNRPEFIWLCNQEEPISKDIMILVAPEKGWNGDITAAQLHEKLRVADEINVQDPSQVSAANFTSKWPGEKLIEEINVRSEASPRYPLNVLDIPMLFPDKRSPDAIGKSLISPVHVPSAYKDERGRWILGITKEGPHGDMSACARWMLLGMTGTISEPHWDAGGVWTLVHTQEGIKLWLAYDQMTTEEMATYTKNRYAWTGAGDHPVHPNPQCGLTPITVPHGWSLLQPGGRVHAPFTSLYALVTGAMYINLADLERTVQLAEIDETHPNMINEEYRSELRSKLAYFIRVEQSKLNETDSDLLARLDKLKTFSERPYCPCASSNKNCKPQECPCRLAKLPCTDVCHPHEHKRRKRRRCE